jgi:hypothetical protein
MKTYLRISSVRKETNMTTTSRPVIVTQPFDAIHWTQYKSKLKVSRIPTGALDLNVDGRYVLGPLQGFGKLWQKTFCIKLKSSRLTTGEVMKTWKEHFSSFWPTWDHFYAPVTGIAPGEVVLINMIIPGDLPIGLPVSTGVVVVRSNEQSFTLMTSQGYMFAGWITFSTYEEKRVVLAQVQVVLRASDPLFELGFRLGANKAENIFWQHTLVALAAHFGVHEPVETHIVCLDPRVQWSRFWNVWQNAAIRTFIYRITRRLFIKRFMI